LVAHAHGGPELGDPKADRLAADRARVRERFSQQVVVLTRTQVASRCLVLIKHAVIEPTAFM